MTCLAAFGIGCFAELDLLSEIRQAEASVGVWLVYAMLGAGLFKLVAVLGLGPQHCTLQRSCLLQCP